MNIVINVCLFSKQ